MVVPCRNELTTLPRQLESLVHQQDAPAFEVLVIDGDSDDGTRAYWMTGALVRSPSV